MATDVLLAIDRDDDKILQKAWSNIVRSRKKELFLHIWESTSWKTHHSNQSLVHSLCCLWKNIHWWNSSSKHLENWMILTGISLSKYFPSFNDISSHHILWRNLMVDELLKLSNFCWTISVNQIHFLPLNMFSNHIENESFETKFYRRIIFFHKKITHHRTCQQNDKIKKLSWAISSRIIAIT